MDSAVPMQAIDNDHPVAWFDTTILKRCNHTYKRKVLESIEIKKNRNAHQEKLANRSGGLKIDNGYNSFLGIT